MELTDSVAEPDDGANLLPNGNLGLAEAHIKCGHLHGRAREPSCWPITPSFYSPINPFATPLRRGPNAPYGDPYSSVGAEPILLSRRKLPELQAKPGGYSGQRRGRWSEQHGRKQLVKERVKWRDGGSPSSLSPSWCCRMNIAWRDVWEVLLLVRPIWALGVIHWSSTTEDALGYPSLQWGLVTWRYVLSNIWTRWPTIMLGCYFYFLTLKRKVMFMRTFIKNLLN